MTLLINPKQMTEKLASAPAPVSEADSGLSPQPHEGIDTDLINRINNIRVKPQYSSTPENNRPIESSDTLPGTKIGDWVYEGRTQVKGDRGNNVFYPRPTEVIRVSKPIDEAARGTREIPVAEFESWKATQEGSKIGRLMTESGAMTRSGVTIPGRR